MKYDSKSNDESVRRPNNDEEARGHSVEDDDDDDESHDLSLGAAAIGYADQRFGLRLHVSDSPNLIL